MVRWPTRARRTSRSLSTSARCASPGRRLGEEVLEGRERAGVVLELVLRLADVVEDGRVRGERVRALELDERGAVVGLAVEGHAALEVLGRLAAARIVGARGGGREQRRRETGPKWRELSWGPVGVAGHDGAQRRVPAARAVCRARARGRRLEARRGVSGWRARWRSLRDRRACPVRGWRRGRVVTWRWRRRRGDRGSTSIDDVAGEEDLLQLRRRSRRRRRGRGESGVLAVARVERVGRRRPRRRWRSAPTAARRGRRRRRGPACRAAGGAGAAAATGASGAGMARALAEAGEDGDHARTQQEQRRHPSAASAARREAHHGGASPGTTAWLGVRGRRGGTAWWSRAGRTAATRPADPRSGWAPRAGPTPRSACLGRGPRTWASRPSEVRRAPA